MATTLKHIDWSPLQVASCMLTSNSISHCIIGEVALMHYQATPTPNQGFSIEICVGDADLPKAAGVLSSSRLFEDVPDHVGTESCYEGTIAHTRLQTAWTVSQPRNIILLPLSAFFDTRCLYKVPNNLKQKGTQLLGLSEEDMAWIPLAHPHELFVALVNRRVDHHDQLAGLTANRLFDTGKLNEPWLAGMHRTWIRRNYDLAMTIIGKTGDPSPVSRNVKNHDHVTAKGKKGGKRKAETLSTHGDAVVKIEKEEEEEGGGQHVSLKRRRLSERRH